MIKNLFDFENEPKIAEESPAAENAAAETNEPAPIESVPAFEVPVESRFFKDQDVTPDDLVLELDDLVLELDDEPTSELLGENVPVAIFSTVRTANSPTDKDAAPEFHGVRDEDMFQTPVDAKDGAAETSLVLTSTPPRENPSSADSTEPHIIFSHAARASEPVDMARARGLAFSAGIAVIGSVTFLMLLGWFADLLLGTKPWGVVGGIILGGFLGFVQLFRIAGQIFRK